MSTYTSIAIKNNRTFLDDRGNIAMVDDAQAIAQACTRAMSTVLGELRFDTDGGVDYMGTIFANGQDGIAAFIVSASRVLASVTGVARVTYFDADYSDGQLKYVANVLSEFGEIIVKSEG